MWQSFKIKRMRLNPYYVAGLVEGEGNFGVVILPKRLESVNWEVRAFFSLSQPKKNRKILYLLKEFFGCGTIRPSKDDTLKYEVKDLKELRERIIPHFERYPLVGEKRKDFKIFKEIILRMGKKEHLKKEGLKEIVELVAKTTTNTKRKQILLKIATSLKE